MPAEKLALAEPLIRGRAMIELLAHLDEFEPGLHERVMTRVPPASAEVITQALATDWILASHTRLVIDGIVAELGPRASWLWASLVQRRLMSSPLLAGLVGVVKRLGGASPQRFLKAVPRGWDNAYKGWCTVRLIAVDTNHAEVVFEQVTSYLFEHRQHWIAIEGVLEGLVRAGGEIATVDLRF